MNYRIRTQLSPELEVYTVEMDGTIYSTVYRIPLRVVDFLATFTEEKAIQNHLRLCQRYTPPKEKK